MSATLKLERRMPGAIIDLVDRKRAWQVHLDGQSVGAITRNEVLELPVDPGHHRLQLISSGTHISPERSFDVRDESIIEFRCHPQPIWPLLLMALFVPHRWIVLKQR
jgi:hypothetical protein